MNSSVRAHPHGENVNTTSTGERPVASDSSESSESDDLVELARRTPIA